MNLIFGGADKSLTGIRYQGLKYRFKTLGFDTEQLHNDFVNLTKEQTEMGQIQELRKRIKDRNLKEQTKENSIETEKNTSFRRRLLPKQTQLINEPKGYGETPLRAFNQEELSFTR